METKNKNYVYTGKGLLDQIESASSWDYELLLENAQVSVKFTEIHDYSVFTPYEFGTAPKRVIVDSHYAIKITEYLTSPGVGTVLYFDKCVKDMIDLNEFYTVTLYAKSIFEEQITHYYAQMMEQMLMNSNVTVLKKKQQNG